ncbi:MAG TPA: hypothetical protein VE135_29010 [Pyrinomonadaceae bacterium]|nr:hypothetical protein [Pyrinomonadaceae bacterium]
MIDYKRTQSAAFLSLLSERLTPTKHIWFTFAERRRNWPQEYLRAQKGDSK